MKIKFMEPGTYKVARQIVETDGTKIFEIFSEADVERYAEGIHYKVVVELQMIEPDPAQNPPEPPAPTETPEDREKREAAEKAEAEAAAKAEAEAAAKGKGGKGSGGK